MGLWGKITLYKYNSCWLIAEGVLIIAGKVLLGPHEAEAADSAFRVSLGYAMLC